MRVLLITLSFYAIANSQMTVGTLVMLMTYQGLLFGPLGHLNSVFARLRRVVSRSAGLFEIMREEDSMQDSKGAKDIKPLHHEIDAKGVSFQYGKSPTLVDINLSLKRGTTTALVGRSGSGKSTLTLLLLRFHDPVDGKISWDGHNLREATRASLRKQIALVPQDTALFNRSVRENIAYGKPGASLEEVITAAKRAHAHEFITQLPNGYDSIVGERGVKLSGGQRQRIAIARVLILEPSLLILDESTSHLDSESEQAIQDSIGQLREERMTQVIIAHRLSTVLHADNIVVMDKGRIIDQGKHEELLSRCATYRTLYKMQFGMDVATTLPSA
jgi:ABC-type multidrug transport system fused ATPase/permease subunit